MDEVQTFPEINNLLSDDPVAQLSLIDKYVKINLIKNKTFQGFIHSIDPVTRSIILFVPQDDTHQIILLPGHAVTEIFNISQPADIKLPARKISETAPKEDITVKKTKLLDWLKQNLLPVSEMGENVVFGNASILPPYSVNDICTDSPIVALQIKKIIEAMPINSVS